MLKIPQLNTRLLMIVKSVKKSDVVADVGTDHGYIPIFLANTFVCDRVFACDINTAPIESCIKNIEKFGATGVTAIVSDGLSAVENEDINKIIIAGMGGEVISKIISSSNLAKKQGVTLILQPMSAYYELKAFLFNNSFKVIDERVAWEGDKAYPILWVSAGEEKHKKEKYKFVGYHVIKSKNAAEMDYKRKILKHYLSVISGMEMSKIPVDEEKKTKYKELVSYLEEGLENDQSK